MTYETDYAEAKANGTLLDPMPTGYARVRDLVPDADLPDVLDSITIGTDGWYDKDFEVWVTAVEGEKITGQAE